MLDKYGVGGEVAVDDRGGARMQVTVTNIMVNGNGPSQVGFYHRYLLAWPGRQSTPPTLVRLTRHTLWLFMVNKSTPPDPCQEVAANKSVRHHSEH